MKVDKTQNLHSKH